MRLPLVIRLPRRTARLRLTALYGGLFLLCGAALLATTYLLVRQATSVQAVRNVPGDGIRASYGPPPYPAQLGTRTRPGSHEIYLSQVLYQMLIDSGIALGIVAAAAVGLGWLMAGRILRPLATITATAHRISASSLHERLGLPGPDDELKALGDTLDGLFARLEASFDAQRHFIANASHELRSPVTRQRALLQVARADPAATTATWQAVSQQVLDSNTEQERLIEALLTLASSEAGLDRREHVDLAAVTSEVLQTPRPVIARLGLHIQAATQPAALDGDPLLTGRLAANLIDNAVCHNIPGGSVQVATRTSGGRAVLSVTSTGPVIAADEVGRLFQPFQRLNGRRARHGNGHGLGLSIVQAIAAAHGADIAAHAPADGGLAIDITFPPPGDPPHPGGLLAHAAPAASRDRVS